MAYSRYKDAAFYSFSRGVGEWKMIDHYSWRHETGSTIYNYADLETTENTTYAVPNGSVLLVNPTNQIVEATLSSEVKKGAEWASISYKVSNTNDKVAVEKNEGGTVTVLMQPHSKCLITCGISEAKGVETPADLSNFPIGNFQIEMHATN
jgi:hypothetical protein